MKGEVAGQEGNFHPTSPGTGMFRTADGYINVAASGDSLWRRFCEAADARDLLENPDFATVVARAKNRPALNAHLDEIIRRHPNAYWVELLNKVGVPCGPINTIDQVSPTRRCGISASPGRSAIRNSGRNRSSGSRSI